jgi:hypothetical protein
VLGKLKRLLAGDAPRVLEIEGVIEAVGTHQPRTHLGAHQPPEERYLALTLTAARLGADRSIDPAAVVPAEFSGSAELLADYVVGERVGIRCSTATGREIAAIWRLPATGA